MLMQEKAVPQTPPKAAPDGKNEGKGRRVGTFTMGWVLVAAGLIMLVSLFKPRLDWAWALRLSPLMLVSLGVETLLAARGGSRVRYDWVAMVLCFVLVCLALVLYAAVWCLLYRTEWVLGL